MNATVPQLKRTSSLELEVIPTVPQCEDDNLYAVRLGNARVSGVFRTKGEVDAWIQDQVSFAE